MSKHEVETQSPVLNAHTEALLVELREKMDELLYEYANRLAVTEGCVVSMDAGMSIDTYKLDQVLTPSPYGYTRIDMVHHEMRDKERTSVFNINKEPTAREVRLRNGTNEINNVVMDLMFRLRALDNIPRYVSYEVNIYTVDMKRLEQGLYPFVYDATLSSSDDTLNEDADDFYTIWDDIYRTIPEWLDPIAYEEYHPKTKKE